MRWFGGDIEPCPASDFPALLDGLVEGAFDRAVMAVENTISGSMLRNFKLLVERDLCIIGEVRMPIVQNLGAWPGVKLEDLTEVRSHHMALNQCRRFFVPHSRIRLVQDEDTAIVARHIAERELMEVGCVASRRALELYGLECLAEDIADHSANLTRFLVLERGRMRTAAMESDLATISLVLPHKTGSLNAALTCLMDCGVSLSKIESMPIVGRPYEYEFVMDLEAENAQVLQRAVRLLASFSDRIVLLGIYGRDRKHEA